MEDGESVATAGAGVDFKIKIKKSAPTGDHQLVFTGRDETGRERALSLTISIQ